MKRIGLLVVVLAFILCSANIALAADGPRAVKSGNICILTDNSGVPTNVKLDLNPQVQLPRSVLRSNVNVVMKCHVDETWQDEYGSSMWAEIGSIVDDAEYGILNSFGISFSPVGVATILPEPSNSNSFLSTISSQSHYYNNNGTAAYADMIVGFTAITDGQIAGRTYLNQPYSVILDRGSRNGESLQHEIGHMYGLARTADGHCPNDCVMTASGWGHINDFCNSCATYWSANANKY